LPIRSRPSKTAVGGADFRGVNRGGAGPARGESGGRRSQPRAGAGEGLGRPLDPDQLKDPSSSPAGYEGLLAARRKVKNGGGMPDSRSRTEGGRLVRLVMSCPTTVGHHRVNFGHEEASEDHRRRESWGRKAAGLGGTSVREPSGLAGRRGVRSGLPALTGTNTRAVEGTMHRRANWVC